MMETTGLRVELLGSSLMTGLLPGPPGQDSIPLQETQGATMALHGRILSFICNWSLKVSRLKTHN